MNKKIFLGLIASFLLSGVVGCSNTQNSNKKMSDKQTNSSKMNMTDEQMKNMKKNDKK